jgi:hypothetical protein
MEDCTLQSVSSGRQWMARLRFEFGITPLPARRNRASCEP